MRKLKRAQKIDTACRSLVVRATRWHEVIYTPIPGTRYRGTYHHCGVTRYRCVVPT